MEIETMFKVEIDKEVEDIINWFTHNYDQEISGWMVGTIEKDLIKVTELLIPHQEVGGASVDTDAKALIKLRKEYGDKCIQIIGHFHSHNTLGNFWSTTDEEFISQYMETREKALFLVSSKSNGHRIRLELRTPVNLSIDELEYSVGGAELDVLGEELRKVIGEKVTESKTITYDMGGLKKGDLRIYGSTPQSLSRENEGYCFGLTDKEINNMITFYNRGNKVVVKNLTSYQEGRLENLGEHESFISGGKWEMEFKCKNKREAKKIVKEIRAELKEGYDFEEAVKDLEDKGY